MNFENPYGSASLREFWRRWHITLSVWLRDYLYISLGGNRGVSKKRAAFNRLVTMSLGGLWHGAGWNFVLWGASLCSVVAGSSASGPLSRCTDASRTPRPWGRA